MPRLSAGAPKVQVRGKFGQTNQIALDTNRELVHSTSLFEAANAISFKASGFYSDALMWILVPATVLRGIHIFYSVGVLPAVGALSLSAFLLVPPLLLIGYVGAQATDTHLSSCLYRLTLIGLGLGLGVL